MKAKEKVRVTRAETAQPKKKKSRRPAQLEFAFVSKIKGQDTLEVRKLTYMDAIRASLEENSLVLTAESEKSFHTLLLEIAGKEGRKGHSYLLTLLDKMERLKIKHETRAEETDNPAKWAYEENKIELLKLGISVVDSYIDGVLALRMIGDVDQYRVRALARFGNA